MALVHVRGNRTDIRTTFEFLNLLLIFQCFTTNFSYCTKCKCMLVQYERYFMVCAPVREDNPLAKACGLSTRTDAQTIQ